ncbi:hypothetical protein MGG_17739 [Pyricularia oryzae 70-15]|uniref:Uncharacterized protein n=4 Tax=Pyricularia oryzae TaxID=318829 RepID=G4NHE2_PYRO7|nr:uncharacterized protein MGG_17739 [Pyricularia oryzae 70-15]ELQ39685.1 hypothetical protein OOU_Y34scaffold00487g30 [Pyricularia oryzae Y34]KAI7924570.1 hypothetical protein M9X92_003770 [Pyricularia oryzae]EHA47652.1 hypothetical protein MGG_17739 [Pyricularia oryzae 70-15]KAI7931920.1 hypothetical protein M0657_000934 [Pyricularia oryzae]QBZ64900.1 hypothetical protein PoMZ_06601 [Pyricularia oryzae]
MSWRLAPSQPYSLGRCCVSFCLFFELDAWLEQIVSMVVKLGKQATFIPMGQSGTKAR